MKQISLTQGKFALVDDDIFEYLSQWNWFASKDPNTFYALRHDTKDNGFKTISMHRQIMEARKGTYVDHKDRNGLNNHMLIPAI